MLILVLLLLVAFVSWSATALYLRFAIVKQLLDSPDARSSHSRDTPTGAGICLALAFFVGLALSNQFGLISAGDALIIALPAGVLSLLGFWDDHSPLSAWIRLGVQLACSGWLILWYHYSSNIFGGGASGCLAMSLAVIAMVWLINLYNFMDGIDGIASAEAFSVCIGWCLINVLSKSQGDLVVPGLIAASVSGFAYWNYPPARIFMGDAGSVFLGLLIGASVVTSLKTSDTNLFVWLILLAVFVVDATVTLLRRIFRGENALRPHRSHAYQVLSRRLGSHKAVTNYVLAINVLWLLPIALLVAFDITHPLLALIFAYFPLVLFAVRLRAGVGELLADD